MGQIFAETLNIINTYKYAHTKSACDLSQATSTNQKPKTKNLKHNMP